MFPHTRNIETSFRQMRLYSILIITGSLSLNFFIVQKYSGMADRMEKRIWLLYGNQVLEAVAGDRDDNIQVEARGHIDIFHHDFFTLDPDEKVITANMTAAFYLADQSAKQVYDNLKENGYYAGIISGNITQRIEVDSIAVDVRTSPYYFRCWATLTITRPTSTVTRDLITEGYLRGDVKRSDHNRHGFLIERWNILENKDIKVENR